MLKLSDIAIPRSIPLKQVSGGGFVVGDAPEEKPTYKPKKKLEEAKVLPFPKKEDVSANPLTPENTPPPVPLETTFLASEEILNQLEITKEMLEVLQKNRALDEYKLGQSVHMVKSKDNEGKTQIRFAKTTGVLIDRKLA